MRSAVVASLVRERERRPPSAASLYLKMPVDDWGLLEFGSSRRSRRAATKRAPPMREWWATRAG